MRPHTGAAIVLLSSALLAPAFAHHPGSHARRQADGTVAVEVSALAGESCTRIAAVSIGAPAGVAALPGATPVTARLERQGEGPCAAVVTPLRAEVPLALAASVRQIMLYVLAPDGTVVGSERLPVR